METQEFGQVGLVEHRNCEAQNIRKNSKFPVTYEMGGVDRIFEMPGHGDTSIRSRRSDRPQEKRGVKHSKTLEVSGKF